LKWLIHSAFTISYTLVLLSFTLNGPNFATLAQNLNQTSDGCISYNSDSDRSIILITCLQPTTLSDVYNSIQNPDVLKREDNNTGI